MTTNYRAIALDFDGVIKQSNESKGLAFLKCFPGISNTQSEYIYKYHLDNPAISRVDKLRLFCDFLGIKYEDQYLSFLLNEFGIYSLDGVLASPWVPGVLDFLRSQYQIVDVYVVTSMPQEDIETILSELRIMKYFKGFYGYPRSKVESLNIILECNDLEVSQLLFIGDAYSDFNAAKESCVDFCLIKSEYNWRLHNRTDIKIVNDFFSSIK